MLSARQQLRKMWSDEARAKALAARRGQYHAGQDQASTPTSAPTSTGETAADAQAKANAYIAAHPDQFAPKGTKGKGKGKGTGSKAKGSGAKGKGAGKAKDPAAEKEKAQRAKEHAEDRAQRQQDRAERQKEHAEDRTQRAADRVERTKEKAQREQEHAQSRAEHEQDRTQRIADRAQRLKDKAAKAKQAKSGGKAGSKSSGSSSADAARQERAQKETRLNSAAAERLSNLGPGMQPSAADANRLISAGLAEQQGRAVQLTPLGQSLLAQKLAKRQRARASEAAFLKAAGFDDLAGNALAKAAESEEQLRAMFASMGSSGKAWPRGANGKRSPHAGSKSNGMDSGVRHGTSANSDAVHPSAHNSAVKPVAETPALEAWNAPTGHPIRSRPYTPEALAAHAAKGEQHFLGFEHENGMHVSVETNTNKKGTAVKGTHRVTITQPNGQSYSVQSNTKDLKLTGQQLQDRGMIYVSPHVDLSGGGTQKRARALLREAAFLTKAELPDLATNAHESLRKLL